MRITIGASGLPGDRCLGYDNVHVGLQRGREVVDLVPGGAEGAHWTIDVFVRPSPGGQPDITGPAVHGRRGHRFLYLSWGTVDSAGDFAMFRRAKLMLDDLAASSDSDDVTAELALSDACGEPLCGAVRPPLVHWSTAAVAEETQP